MKILQLIQKPQLRGAEIFACQLSNHLLKDKHSVKLITVFPGTASLPFNGEIIQLDRPLSKRLWDLEGWAQFAKIVKSEDPDVIQANAGDTLKFAVLSKKFFGWRAPIVFRNANKMGDFVNTRLKFYLNKFFLDNVDYTISVSKLCEEDLKATFNFPSDKICTIPIGVEEFLVPNTPPADLEHIFKRYKVFVNVGSLVPEKNHEALLRIFEQVATYDSDAFLIIIGGGYLESRLKSLSNELNASNRILFAGYRNDVLQVVKSSFAFLMPSLIEGLPGVILEAMYCKTPVIANNVGGISEVVNEETGWLIEKGDEQGFVNAVLEVLDNKNIIESRTRNALHLVMNYYTNKELAKEFNNVYLKLRKPSVESLNAENV